MNTLLAKLLGSTIMYAPPDDPASGTGAPPPSTEVENNDAAGGAGDPPAGDAGDPPVAGADGGEGDPPAAPRTPKAPQKDWRDRELSRKHAQIQEEKRKTAALERELEDMRALQDRGAGDPPPAAGAADPPAPPPAPRAKQPAAPDPAAVRTEAEKIVATQDYNRGCDATFKAGEAEYGKAWDTTLENLKTLGGIDVPDMLNILAADEPHQVLHKLGSNPEEFQRVMDLPPAKRMAEFVKLGLKPAKAPAKVPSGAPEPVEPLGGRGAGDQQARSLYNDKIPDAEWHTKRDAERLAYLAKKRGMKVA